MTKKRTVLTETYSGLGQILSSGVETYRDLRTFNFVAYQQTDSTSHPFHKSSRWKRENLYNSQDLGGSFDTRISTCESGARQVSIVRDNGAGTIRQYHGPFFAYRENFTGSKTDLPDPSSWSTLDSLGSTAIRRTLPTNPVAGLGQFLAELRDLPKPSELATWAAQSNRYKDLRIGRLLKRGSNDWLNFQFGWVPFVKDVKDTLVAIRDADRIIAQYQRDSGKNIRRRYRFPTEVSTTVTELGNSYGAPTLDSYLIDTPGKLSKTVHITRDVWFSGCYTYYLPKAEGMGRIGALANKLFGLRLTPALIWDIAPWTWAADWLTNFGDVVHNMSAFANDGLVLRYGYVMETKTTTTEYVLTGIKFYGLQPMNFVQRYVQTTKLRRKATPFGFGFDPGTFTARQWSIIAALGISRAPRSLNF